MTIHFKNLNEISGVFYFLISSVLITLSADDFNLLIPCFMICILYGIFLECFKTALFCLPGVILLVLLNPLFNHTGNTPLFYVNDDPYTLEALIVGIRYGMIMLSLIIWFQASFRALSLNRVFHLLSKILPTTALMLTMIYKSTNDINARREEVSSCQKSFLKPQKGVIKKIKLLSAELLAVSQNALEGSVIKGISMSSRGFELKGKTSVYKISLKRDDHIFICVSLVLLLFYFIGVAKNVFICVFLLLPAIYQIKEEIKWHFLQSKI